MHRLGVFDIEKCFDALSLERYICTLPEHQGNDKLVLVYEANRNNFVTVKTGVGLTDVEKIVTQGGTFGPIECSNSIDKIGQKCFNEGEHLFSYKKMVNILPLSYVDDLLNLAKCGSDSLAVNTFINA